MKQFLFLGVSILYTLASKSLLSRNYEKKGILDP